MPPQSGWTGIFGVQLYSLRKTLRRILVWRQSQIAQLKSPSSSLKSPSRGRMALLGRSTRVTAYSRISGLSTVNIWPSENAALWPAAVVGSAQLVEAARVIEHGEVKVDSLFGVRVEPEKRRTAGEVIWTGCIVQCSATSRL